MADGFALVEMLLSMADDAARTQSQPSAATGQSRVEAALRFARRVPGTVAGVVHLLLLPFDPPSRYRGALSGRRRVAWSAPIPLDRMRALAHARGSTINDVLMSVLAGAVRAYLAEHGESAGAFRAVVPVNLRTQPTAAIDERSGNWFGLVFVELPIAAADRESRLAALKREIDRIKASEEALASLVVLTLLGRVPKLVEAVFKELFARKATIVVSNVIGPRRAFTFLGERVRELLFWVPHPNGLSCGISILSYDGMVRVGVRSDEARVADPEQLARLFERELDAWDAGLRTAAAASR